jgi:putative flippase GtrA
LQGSRRQLLVQLASFGAVGGVGLLIDVGVFNLLRSTILAPENVHSGPVIAKVISTSLAILANWLGNRSLTFRAQRRSNAVREGIEFAMVSVVGMIIAVGCLVVSHYVLGFRSVFADNIATNVVGLGIGTAFRFAFYRWWVFADPATRLTYSNISSKLGVWRRAGA